MDKNMLSKTRYCNGVQCPKMLWLQDNKPWEAVDLGNTQMFIAGNKVGDLARSYFGDFQDAEIYAANGKEWDLSAMVTKTKTLLKRKTSTNITEASFTWKGLFCAVDILHRDGDGWQIVEVKSSGSVKDAHYDDVAFQLYVLEHCGIKVTAVKLMHLDTGYVRYGDLNLRELFVVRDLTDSVRSMQEEVADNIVMLQEYMRNRTEPEQEVGCHCESPYLCPFYKYCRGPLPEGNVFDMHGGMHTATKYKLFNMGIKTYQDMLDNKVRLNEKMLQQAECGAGLRGVEVNKQAIRDFLNKLTYPIYHLDFETFQEAIPSYDGERCYMQVPFQYSLHIEHKNGRLEHREFLAKEGTDPRWEIAEALCRDIPRDVCSMAYNMSFEKQRLGELAALVPDLAGHLYNIRENMHDLMAPFKNRDCYAPAMHGSHSIKAVLPALWPDDPELNYQNLQDVHNGVEASAAYVTLREHTPEEIKRIRETLLKYCELDTLAMVKILAKLRELSKAKKSKN